MTAEKKVFALPTLFFLGPTEKSKSYLVHLQGSRNT